MNLRKTQASDAASLAHLYDLVWSQEIEVLGERLARERAAKAEEVCHWIKNDNYFVIEEDKQLVAALGCELRLGTLHLVHLVVHPQFRRRGYARQLMEKAEEFARESGAVKLWFDTAPGFEAARAAWREVGSVRLARPAGGWSQRTAGLYRT